MPSIKELIEGIEPEPLPTAPAKQLPAHHPMSHPDDVFNFILKGLNDSPTKGNRNNFIHIFASECNRFGVGENECYQNCLQYKQSDFTSGEIRAAVRSAYQRTAEHGTKIFTTREQWQAVKPQTAKPSYQSYQTTPPQANGSDYSALLNKCELDYLNPPDRPPTALKINGQIISTLGNFCAVIGKAKSRKTFFLTSIAAAALKGESLNVTSELPENKRKVLIFDTEQGEYHVFKTFDRIRSQAGQSNNLHIFHLREIATADRVHVIEIALQTVPNIGLVIIDGLRDLISDINSQEQATIINDKLLQWTSKFNIAIFIVIHQNKADSNARGHVGTEIVNKAETVLSVEKNSKNVDVSTVKAEYCRNMDFEPFSFLINDDGLPELTEFECETTGRSALKPESFNDTLHHQILESIFKDAKELKYSEVQSGIISEFEKIGHRFGNNKSREFFNYYEDNGFLTRHGLPQSKNSYFELSLLTNHLG